MGYTESHACKAALHETIDFLKFQPKTKQHPLNFSHKSAKAKPQKSLKTLKIRHKKGVSLRSFYFITIHLYVLQSVGIFFVRFRTFPYFFFHNSPICTSKLLKDSYTNQQLIYSYNISNIQRRIAIAPFKGNAVRPLKNIFFLDLKFEIFLLLCL